MLLKRTFTLKNKIEFKSNKKEKTKFISKSIKKEKKEAETIKVPKKLSNYIKTDINVKYILKNKSALKEYEIFLNRFKKKKNENENTFGSINKNYEYQNKMSIFKDNPRLIISSYKTNFFDDTNKKKRYQNNILGVDEGLITLPKINIEEEQKKYILNERVLKTEGNDKNNKNNGENKNGNLTNIYSHTEIKMENKNNNSILNNENNINVNNLDNKKVYNNRMTSIESYKSKKKSYLDRGEELISRLSKNRYFKKENQSSNYKANKTLDSSHRFKYEIRRLSKWDFNNLSKENESNTERINTKEKIKDILSEIRQSQQMNWLTEIKNNKEQFKLICRNKHLKDFINKINDEQNAIYSENIKVLKKDFDFNIFDKKNNNNNTNENDINNKNKNEVKTDTYNKIIKDKMKLEENLSKEVSLCAEEVNKYKNEIENQKKIKYNLNNDLYKIKKEEEKINEEYNENVKRLDLLLQQLENAIMQKNAEIKNARENNNYKYNDNKNIKISPKNNIKNKSRGNFKSNKISIINSLELIQIRTLSNKNINDDKFQKANSNSINNSINTINIRESNNIISNNELIETKDDELIIKNNLLSQKNILDSEHKQELSKINSKRNEINNEKNKIEEEIKKLHNELSIAKNNLDAHIHSLSDYYYQILKKGIDVRRNGLSWVIIKLMELNAFIDYNHFPNFLDIHQMNYLMRIGAKIYEVKELIKLFQLLKNKEKVIKERYYIEDRNKEKIEKIEKLNLIKKLNNNKIGNNYAEFLGQIQQKYDNAVNFNIDEEIEDKQINKTSKYLKDIILYDKKMELYFIPGSLAEYFSKDKKFRQYFDDVYYLNEEINKRQRDINKDREIELKYYRNKYKNHYDEHNGEENKRNNINVVDKEANLNKNKFLIGKETEDDDKNARKMVFAALFGNATPM